MECDRLKKLVRNWYVQVQDEAMAPARMVDFMRNHVAGCLTCMADPLNEIEIKRITEIVLPPTKILKAIRKESDDLEPRDEDAGDPVEDDEAEAEEGEEDDEAEDVEDDDDEI
jgi:hypothetical protein